MSHSVQFEEINEEYKSLELFTEHLTEVGYHLGFDSQVKFTPVLDTEGKPNCVLVTIGGAFRWSIREVFYVEHELEELIRTVLTSFELFSGRQAADVTGVQDLARR
jgi:hypothetical protein